MSISRIAKLEQENIALQEEVLSLKRQLMNQRRKSGGGSRPGSPEPIIDDNKEALDELEMTVKKLKESVRLATNELRKYRSEETMHTMGMVGRLPISDDKKLSPQRRVVEKPKTDDFDLDDLLN